MDNAHPHNFTSEDGGTNTEVCIFCHTPHNARVAVPLWNHSASTAGSYTNYSSSTLNAGTQIAAGGTGISNFCMSCHDGTVAVSAVKNIPAPGGTQQTLDAGTIAAEPGFADSANFGTDLTNDHPVGFVYNSALANEDGNLDWPISNAAVQLFGASGTLECASCHDPHGNGAEYLLVTSNGSSALCDACHAQ